MKYSYMKALESTQGNRARLEKRAGLEFLNPRYRDEVRSEKYNLYNKAKTTPWAQALLSGVGSGLTAGLGGLIGGGAMHIASDGADGAALLGALAGAPVGWLAPRILAAAMAKMHSPDTEAERVARLKKNKLKKALIPGYAAYDNTRTAMTAKDAIMSRTRRRDEAIAAKTKEF
jgi:hypothetical protein